MTSHTLHPTMHPTRHRDESPTLPRLGGQKRNHPSWRGRYVHAPRQGARAVQVIVKTTWHPRGARGFRSLSVSTAYEIRYLRKEHDVSQDVERAIYSPDQDRLSTEERTAFTQRTRMDGWQWRMVLSPDYGTQLDLTEFTRDFLRQVERDTAYRLDWVAANHYNTAHPHSHIILRGKDLQDLDVGFKRDYLTRSMAYRARDLATEQLDRHRTLEQGYELGRTMERHRAHDYDQGLDRG